MKGTNEPSVNQIYQQEYRPAKQNVCLVSETSV